ncbi:apoptosis-inducing factor short [Jimgerdemannia flammicorona]|uniref:Apoptosis-inducing factor short n=1 Tax=Jimgerdemannia flammicorona TaxID=994334 RepID=A0A432ZYV7_9FUNG|nr:apoptosis-inducing factor short [Jimgerdemannia flammicorona]
MALVFPRSLSQWTTTQIEKDGVKVLRNSTVTSIQSAEDNGVKLILDNGEAIQVDHVIVAIGVEPRVDLARQAGLEIDGRLGGVVVNTELEGCSIFFGFHYNVFPLLNVPRSDVFVAGDISSFYDNILGRRRVEHHDHLEIYVSLTPCLISAMLSGRLAGENMVGAKKPYSHQPMFWSDLGYEAVGLIDSQLNTVSVFSKTKQGSLISTSSENSSDTHKSSAAESAVTSIDHENFGKGVVFYLNDSKKIVGVLMFNVFGKVQVAREILGGSYSQQDINTLIERFDIHGGAQQ